MPKLKWWQWGLIAFGVIATISLMSEDRPTQMPAANEAKARPILTRLVDDVSSASRSGDILIAHVDLEGALDEAGYVSAAGRRVMDIGGALQKGIFEDQPPASKVRVLLRAPTVDRLGNEQQEDFLTLEFSASDLRQANYRNLYAARVLNLATLVEPQSTPGLRSIASWCLNADNVADATEFCSKGTGG